MSEIKGYHAHVYYDVETKPKAVRVVGKIGFRLINNPVIGMSA